jgi:hypothetical protein
MTWSYNASTLATTPKDQVRLLIGDVVSTDEQLQDEEITFLLTQRSSIYGTAAECCRSLASKFARSVDQTAGDTKLAYSQLSKAYTAKATAFENKAALSGSGMPYAGGISVADKQNQEQDTDRVQPQFNVGMDENETLPVGVAGNETPASDTTSGGA